MKSALATLWNRNRWLVMAFALALAVTLFLAVRTALSWLHWHDPPARDQPIEPWMTPRYVAMSWHIPPQVMQDALDQPHGRPHGRPKSIAEIAAEMGLTEQQLVARMQQAIADFRAQAGAQRP